MRIHKKPFLDGWVIDQRRCHKKNTDDSKILNLLDSNLEKSNGWNETWSSRMNETHTLAC